jgi:DNA protecting protein DprA
MHTLLPPFETEFETRHYRAWDRNPGADLSGPPPASLFGERPPTDLYIRGRSRAFELLRWLPEFGFAVVGTRRPQTRSLALVHSRLRALEGTQLIIISGLALGVDAAAHEAALDWRLPTVAVLAGPLDEIYPPENRALAERILRSGGLLVSEYPSGSRIEKHFFLLRNRIIAGWAKATWIVEASFRSGALNTAGWAWEYNRDTYATPCFPDDPAHAGNQGLIQRDKAYAFWAPNTLKASWSEFKNLGHARRIHPLPSLWDSVDYEAPEPQNDLELLTREVVRATVQRGGASVDFLLDWAVSRDWEPSRFFETLQKGLQNRRIDDRNGILCSFNRPSRA